MCPVGLKPVPADPAAKGYEPLLRGSSTARVTGPLLVAGSRSRAPWNHAPVSPVGAWRAN